MMGGVCRVQVGEVGDRAGGDGARCGVFCSFFAHSLQPWDSLNCVGSVS